MSKCRIIPVVSHCYLTSMSFLQHTDQKAVISGLNNAALRPSEVESYKTHNLKDVNLLFMHILNPKCITYHLRMAFPQACRKRREKIKLFPDFENPSLVNPYAGLYLQRMTTPGCPSRTTSSLFTQLYTFNLLVGQLKQLLSHFPFLAAPLNYVRNY